MWGKGRRSHIAEHPPSELLTAHQPHVYRGSGGPEGVGENLLICLSGVVNSGNDCSCLLCQGLIWPDCSEVRAKMAGSGFWLPETVVHQPFAQPHWLSNFAAH